MTEEKKIPLHFHIIYFLLAAVLAYLYYLRIVIPHDPASAHSIDSVSSLHTYKPYQFRLLIPFIFFLLKPLSFIPQKTIYLFYTIIIVYSTILVYFKVLSNYFQNKKAIYFLAPVILYPMLWNYVILNQSYQYYDFTSILIFTIGIYFIIKEKFTLFLIVFIIGIFNKETAGYLVFVYLLYNYKTIFTKKVILKTILLLAVYNAIKLILTYIFWNNPGSSVEICMDENIRILTTIMSNKIYIKQLALNFGGLYIFIFLLFISGRWKNYGSRRLLYINLAFLANIFIGFFVTYFNEVRVYAEFIPLVTTLFLIYLSTYKKLNLQPLDTAS